MANVLPQQIEFPPRPVAYAPSPLGFGFGRLSATSNWHSQPTPGHHNPIPFHNLASTINSPPVRAQKRRHELDEEVESAPSPNSREDGMEPNPIPDKPRRSAPKRARVQLLDANTKHPSAQKDGKGREEPDVDVGILLASIPSQSLLPILMSLLNTHPSLRSAILPLIPRPTLESAIETLAQSAKKLREAYPYSNVPSSPPQTSSQSHSFGFGQQPSSQSTGGMRGSYILSRLRPHIADFTAACLSYMPYFSYIPSSITTSPSNSEEQSERMSAALQALHKDQSHPSETFIFLSAITNHFLSQPPLTQTALAQTLLPRLVDEWKAWVERLDEVVNGQGGMFGSETVQGWARWLDDIAGHRIYGSVLCQIRDGWVAKVGWLVGRYGSQHMDDL